jgi:hypothetical protein
VSIILFLSVATSRVLKVLSVDAALLSLFLTLDLRPNHYKAGEKMIVDIADTVIEVINQTRERSGQWAVYCFTVSDRINCILRDNVVNYKLTWIVACKVELNGKQSGWVKCPSAHFFAIFFSTIGFILLPTEQEFFLHSSQL